tara:strand:- start:999 stop:2234 length:1236 start_codon:yes stop_codon:yes gene_type:complete
MFLKNITNNLLILSFLFLNSCSGINLKNINSEADIPEKKEQNHENIFEKNNLISKKYNGNSLTNKKFNKLYTIKINKNKNDYDFNNFAFDGKNLYVVDDNLYLNIFDFEKGNLISKNKINIDIDNNLLLPISISNNENYFFAGLGNGTIIKFDSSGKLYWRKDFNDILKTPIKFHNDKIIILFNSNRIISINSDNGEIHWDHKYELNKASSSYGGKIIFKNNILYFISPKGNLGAIDTIIGEKIDNHFINLIKQTDIMNNNYEIDFNVYENSIVFFENKKILNTYDNTENNFLLFDEEIYSANSFNFLNNTILILDDSQNLKAYNIENKKIFWEIKLSKIISKKDKIIQTIIGDEQLIIFFSKGKVLHVNKLNGEIIFDQKILFNNIYDVSIYNNYIAITQINGNTTFYNQ